MRTTDRGLLALVRHEGLVPGPYLDVRGVWTFGIGHTAAAGPPDPARMARGMPADLGRGHPRGVPALSRRSRGLRGRGAARREGAARTARVRCAGLLPLQHRRDRPGGADPPSQRRRPRRRRAGVHGLAQARCDPVAPGGRTGPVPRWPLSDRRHPGLGGGRQWPGRFLAADPSADRGRGAGAAAPGERAAASAMPTRPQRHRAHSDKWLARACSRPFFSNLTRRA